MQILARNLKMILFMLALVLLGACVGTVQDLATTRHVKPENATYALKPDQALIVFMRPSRLNGAYDAAIFDVTDGAPEFVASVSKESKLAYYVKPGERRYVVVGANADWLSTNLEAGKVYYVLVSPSYGLRLWFRAFRAKGPFTQNNLDPDSPKFSEWFNRSRWVENVATPPNPEKVDTYMEVVRFFINEWTPKWEQRIDKPRLDPDDGRTRLFGG